MIRKVTCPILVILLLAALISGCDKSATNQTSEFSNFTSFQDVPGVTQQEIAEAQSPWFIGVSVLSLLVLVLTLILFYRNRRIGRELEKLVAERTNELELRTATLTAIFDSSPDFIYCKDLESRYLRCNESSNWYFSTRTGDAIGKTDFEAYHMPSELAEMFVREDQKVISEKRPIIFEGRAKSKTDDGKEIFFESLKAPVMKDGEVIGVMGITRDITSRKIAESELALQTTTLATLIDSIPDLIFTKDLNLCFTHCNKSFENHFGKTKEFLIGKDDIIGLGLPAEKAEEFREWDRNVINECRIISKEELAPPRPDGKILLVETIKTPLMLDGVAVGVLGIARDITERKKTEEAALAASRSKSVFLANMSHEIRTPMNSIIGFSELALDGEASPKTKDYLEKIIENADGLLQIINDVLDISKVESGKMELERIPFDLHELFTACRTIVLPKALEKGVIMHFYAEPSIEKKLLGDPTRLRQALLNLLSNAVKFTHTGIIKLNATVKGRSDNDVSIYFEVKDSGIGMTGEEMKKIFEPFAQAEAGTTRKYGGTGLGLTITKSIIELMGGELIVESVPGVGSKFSFLLTLETIDVSSSDMPGKTIALTEIEKPVFEGEVLLCEDNAMNQQVIYEHLSRVGLKTVVAGDGKIGVEMVKSRMRKNRKQFDLILMDIHMPVMDGIEASQKILDLNLGIPIVALTANIMASDWEVYKESGMNDCVGKPFTSQELWLCLLKYLKPLNSPAAQVQKDNPDAAGKQTPVDLVSGKSHQLVFVQTNKNVFSELVSALEANDIKLAHRLAHNIKSNAGHIEKTNLQKAALDVELGLTGGKNLVSPEQLVILERELNGVLAEFTPQLNEFSRPTDKDEGNRKVLDIQSTRELKGKLEVE